MCSIFPLLRSSFLKRIFILIFISFLSFLVEFLFFYFWFRLLLLVLNHMKCFNSFEVVDYRFDTHYRPVFWNVFIYCKEIDLPFPPIYLIITWYRIATNMICCSFLCQINFTELLEMGVA